MHSYAAGPAEPASKSVPIKHTRPKVQKFDNGFIIEDTAMGPAEGKVRCPATLHARPHTTHPDDLPARQQLQPPRRLQWASHACLMWQSLNCSHPCSLVITNSAAEVLSLRDQSLRCRRPSQGTRLGCATRAGWPRLTRCSTRRKAARPSTSALVWLPRALRCHHLIMWRSVLMLWHRRLGLSDIKTRVSWPPCSLICLMCGR